MASFSLALEFVLQAEGGYTVDHAGPTNHGVVQSTYDEYRDLVKEPRRSVKEITSAEVEDLYFRMFWKEAHCDKLGPALRLAHMDWAVNHGVTGAIRTLQEATGSKPDGIWGPKTQAAVMKYGDIQATVKYMAARDKWYDDNQADVAPWAYNGWRNRVHRLWGFICLRVMTR